MSQGNSSYSLGYRTYFPILCNNLFLNNHVCDWKKTYNIPMPLPIMFLWFLTFYYVGMFFFKSVHIFEVLPSTMFSYPMDSWPMVTLNKRLSSDCTIPIYAPLYLRNTVHAMSTLVADVSSIHQTRLSSWYLLVLNSIGCLQCSNRLWFSSRNCSNSRHPSSHYIRQIFIIFPTIQNPVICIAVQIWYIYGDYYIYHLIASQSTLSKSTGLNSTFFW